MLGSLPRTRPSVRSPRRADARARRGRGGAVEVEESSLQARVKARAAAGERRRSRRSARAGSLPRGRGGHPRPEIRRSCGRGAAGRSRAQLSSRDGAADRWLPAFWTRAYGDNVSGLSAIVTYDLMLAIPPFGLLTLFILARSSNRVTSSRVCSATCSSSFPRPSRTRSNDALDRVARFSTRAGVALIARSGSAPRSGVPWTPRSAASTTSRAAAGSSRSASRC